MANQDILYRLYIEKNMPKKDISLKYIENFAIEQKSFLKFKNYEITTAGIDYAILKFILRFCSPLNWPEGLWGDFQRAINSNRAIWKKYPNLKVIINDKNHFEISNKTHIIVYPQSDSTQLNNPYSINQNEYLDDDMVKFIDFIVEKIENETILGKKGWLEQLMSYQWPPEKGDLKEGMNLRRHFHFIVNLASNSIGRYTEIFRYGVCNAIAGWGGLHQVSKEDCSQIFNSIDFINNHLDKDVIDYNKIFGKRIALSSKLYYFSNPLNWTIYDSRVAFTLTQMTYAFKNKNPNIFMKLKGKIAFPIPPTQSKRVHPLGIKWIESEASLWFIRSSILLKTIAEYLNTKGILPPKETISPLNRWELYHVEMVFFQLGKRAWGNNF